MTGSAAVDTSLADGIIARAVELPLAEAGFVRTGTGLSWSWTSESAFVAVSALAAADADRLAYSLMVGWRYEAFGDPGQEPDTAHGCVRQMTFDQLGQHPGRPLGNLGIADERALAGFEQRLATIVRKHLVRWIEAWKRPDGYRDFLASRNYHLAAGWASALLDHDERARLELVYAAHLYNQPLDGSFDRMRADHDGALAAVFAAPNGLAALLARSDAPIVGAFSSERGAAQKEKVVDPQSAHRRLQLRHAALSDTCLRFLGSR